MSGIAGIIVRDGSAVPISKMDRLCTALGHRGPDGEGRV